jgi:DNA-binding protein H-NS
MNTNPTFAELLANKAAIEAQIVEAKASAFSGVLASIVNLCDENGYALDEMAAALLTKHKKRTPRPGKKPVHAAKFRNKLTGATWSGIGRRPRWFSDMSNVETL